MDCRPLREAVRAEQPRDRATDGKQAAAKFDIDQIRNGKTKDLELRSGDVIVVNSSTAKVAFQNVLKVLPLASIFVTLL